MILKFPVYWSAMDILTSLYAAKIYGWHWCGTSSVEVDDSPEAQQLRERLAQIKQ